MITCVDRSSSGVSHISQMINCGWFLKSYIRHDQFSVCTSNLMLVLMLVSVLVVVLVLVEVLLVVVAAMLITLVLELVGFVVVLVLVVVLSVGGVGG